MKQIKENDKLRREITAIRKNRLHRRWQKAVTMMAALVLLYTVSVLVQPASALVGESKAAVGIQEEAEDTNDTAALEIDTDTVSDNSQDASDDEISSKDDPEPSEDDADDMSGEEAGNTGANSLEAGNETENPEVNDPEATSGTGSSEIDDTKDISEDGEPGDPEPSQETDGSEITDPEPEDGNTGSNEPAAAGSAQSTEDGSEDTGSEEASVPESVEDPENAADDSVIAQDPQDGNGSGEAAAGGALVVTEEIPAETPLEEVPALEDEFFKGTLRYIEPGDYRISVAITEEAGIPKKPRPRLKVEELEPGSEKYKDHYEKAEKEILDGTNEIKFARFFDITILSDEEEIEPEEGAGLDITITYAKQIIVPEDGEKLAVHFINEDEIEVLDATGDPEVVIEAEEDEEAEPAQQAPEEDIQSDAEEDIKSESEETEDPEAPFGAVEGSDYVAVNANGEVIDPEDHLTDKASAEDTEGSVPEEDEEEDAEGMFDEADFEGESDLYRFSFSQDSFSVVGTVVTGRLDTRFIDSAGDTWQIIASFGADAGIPGDAELRVSEILQGNEKYADYYADARLAAAAKANVTLDREALKAELSSKIENGEPVPARFFDIKIVDESEQPVQPAEGSSVKVEIYLTEENNFVIAEDTEISTVHFGAEKTEVLGSTTGTMDGEDGTLLVESVEFSTESFSVFALVWGDEPDQRATIHFGTASEGTFKEFEQETINFDTTAASISIANVFDGYEYFGSLYYKNSAYGSEDVVTIYPDLHKNSDGSWEYYYTEEEDGEIVEKHGTVAPGSNIYVEYVERKTHPSGADDDNVPSPTTTKTVTDNHDGTQTIQIDVEGQSVTEDHTQYANVLIILDATTSMRGSKWTMAKRAVDTLIRTLTEDRTAQGGKDHSKNAGKIDFAITTFGPTGTYRTGTWGTDWTKNNVAFRDWCASDSLAINSQPGTNWESGLWYGYNVLAGNDGRQRVPDSDPTYVIFVTDGDPYGYGRTSYTQSNNVNSNATQANEEAQLIARFPGTLPPQTRLYGIFTGEDNQGNRQALTRLRNVISNNGGVETVLATPAQIEQKFQDIAETMLEEMGAGNVTVDDGVTTLSSVSAQVPGKADAFEYQISEDGTTWSEWAEAPGASFSEDNGVTWDLSSTGSVKAGDHYRLRFKVWPSQEAYDLIANLNNGTVNWDDLDGSVQSQFVRSGSEGNYTYSLKTNTHLNTTYTFNGTSYSDAPEELPNGTMVLEKTQMTVKKAFAHTINSQDPFTSIMFYLTVDGKYYQTDGTTNEELVTEGDVKAVELPVNTGNSWTNHVYIAPGFIDLTSDGYEVLEKGHKYSLEEKVLVGSEYEYEFTPQTVRPMVIGGTLKYLILEDKYNKRPDGAATYTIDGEIYYEAPSGNNGTLTGTNRKTAELDITKIVDTKGILTKEEEEEESFTYRVTLGIPDGCDPAGIVGYEYVYRPTQDNAYYLYGYHQYESGTPVATAFEDDIARLGNNKYRAWNTLVYRDLVEWETVGGKIVSKRDAEGNIIWKVPASGGYHSITYDMTLKQNEVIRFTNLPSGTKYTIQEIYANKYPADNVGGDTSGKAPVSDPSNISSEGYEISAKSTHGDVSTTTVVNDTVSGTIEDLDERVYNQFTNTMDPDKIVGVTLKGTKHLSGYEWSGEKYHFTLAADAEDAPMPAGTGSKTEFDLTAESGTDDKSDTFGTIRFTEAGTYTYTIQEDNAGTLQIVNGKAVQYGAAETITIKIAADNDGKLSVESVTPSSENTTWDEKTLTANTTITNTAPTVDVTATKAWLNADASTTPPVGASVVFTLYADGTATDKTVTLDGTVDANGEAEAWKATFSGLQEYNVVEGETAPVPITYTIGETGKWLGYELVKADPVSSGGTLTNKQVPKYVRFMKTNDNGETLGGAQFTFSALEGNLVSAEPGTTDGDLDISGLLRDESGKYTFELNVSEEAYVLSETVVPKGYYPPDGEVHVRIGANQVIAELIKAGDKTKDFDVSGAGTEADPYVVTITNSTGAALPSTGGHGTLPYTLGGLLMILGSALMLGFRRKSRITV